MRWHHPKTLFIIALGWLQLCLPVVGISMELACAEKTVQVCATKPCCQTQTPAQMTCCASNAPIKNQTAPPAIIIPARVFVDLATPSSFTFSIVVAGSTATYKSVVSTSNTHFAENHLYKLLATFLI